MQLKLFTSKNSRSHVGESSVTFSRKGYIGISRRAVEKLGLKEGQGIYFAQDEQNPKDWYLGVNTGGKHNVQDCFTLKKTGATQGFALSNIVTAAAFYDSVEEVIPDDKSCISLPLSTLRTVINGQTLLAIVTKNLKIENE